MHPEAYAVLNACRALIYLTDRQDRVERSQAGKPRSDAAPGRPR